MSLRFTLRIATVALLAVIRSLDAQGGASACAGGIAGLDSVAAGIISAVNDGSYSALSNAFGKYWYAQRIPAERRADILTSLARWHWVSRELTSPRACAVSPNTAYVTARNQLTGETDSLFIVFPPPAGKVGQTLVFQGSGIPIAPNDTVSDEARARSLGDLVRAMGKAGAFAGEVLFAKGGKVLYHEAVGPVNRATGEPAQIGQLYSIASSGKLVTGTALMRLVEEGRLSLDDTLGKFLPAGERPAAAAGIALKYILSHTDGMVRDQDSLAFQPGTRFAYVNYGYYLLGKVIENVTGGPFIDYYASAVFRPAGMLSTKRLELTQPDPKLPPGYVFAFDSGGARFDVNPQLQTIPATGAGGLFSTVDDLFHFAEALRTGRIISLASLDEMRKPRREFGAFDYGYGVDWFRGNNIWGHTGGIPGANADIELYGDSGYLLVVLGNTGTNDPIRRRAGALLGRRALCARLADAQCRS